MGGGEQGPSTGLIPGGRSRQGQASRKARAQRQGCAQVREPIKTASLGFAGGTREKKPACQCRRHKRRKFDPWVGKIPWRRAWQPTAVFLPGESHGQRSLAGCGQWGHEGLDTTKRQPRTQHTREPRLKAAAGQGDGALQGRPSLRTGDISV